MNTIPPCAGRYALFDSTDPVDHAEARAICLHRCPLLEQCRDLLAEVKAGAVRDGGPQGTWAGDLQRTSTGRPARSAETLAAESARYDEDEARRAHNAWTHWGDKSEWAEVGERVYQRRRAARKKAA